MARAAVIKGKFLRPSVSSNRRVYTPKNIKSAVDRMNQTIATEGSLPITMATGHGAARKDDALSTIGRVTKVGIDPNGWATFEADVADTTAGRDVAKLAVPDADGKSFIKGVSIRGRWASQPREVVAEDGDTATTADDLEVSGIDLTGRPGVDGAGITDAELAEAVANDPALIFESIEDGVEVFMETAPESTDEAAAAASKTPYGNVSYGDPGYQTDKKKRYPLDTEAHCRAAWAYINMPKNQKPYTAQQVKRIKSRIKSAAKKHGIDIVSESDQLATEIQEILEAYASVNLDNGAAGISVSGYTDDAAKLAPMAKRLAFGALAALNAIDPDTDGDVDLVMPDGTKDSSSSYLPNESDDDDMECANCGDPMSSGAMYCPTCGQAVATPDGNESTNQSTEQTQENTVPTETVTAPVAPATPAAPVAEAAAPAPVAEAAPTRTLTDADVTAIGSAFATAVAPLLASPAPVAEAAPVAPTGAAPAVAPVAAAPATPAAPVAPVVETADPATADLIALQAAIDAAADAKIAEAAAAAPTPQAQFAAGGVPRKGLVDTSGGGAAGVVEAGELDAEALAKMDSNTFYKTIGPVWESQKHLRFASAEIVGS